MVLPEHYYNGLRGQEKLGPKHIYSNNEIGGARTMQLLTVHEHPKLGGKNNLWPTIRTETVRILDLKKIQFSSVDLVRFRWEPTENDRGGPITSNVTIWIGVLPNSTNADAASNCAKDIIDFLDHNKINDIDVAFRESEAYLLTRPILYTSVKDVYERDNVFDWLGTPLSFPIAGLSTPNKEGSLGCYFKIGEDLYGVTARHVLFQPGEGNNLYISETSATKDVILMGDKAYQDVLTSIQNLIHILTDSRRPLYRKVKSHKEGVEDGKQGAQQKLEQYQPNLDDTDIALETLKRLLENLQRDWAEVNKRVIGHVVWSPPITSLDRSHSIQDVCVIKLNKDKLLPALLGNIELIRGIGSGKFMGLLSSQFDYPEGRLQQLKNILDDAKAQGPNNGEPMRFVFKRGTTTLTTLGRLNDFDSYVRRYDISGYFDFVHAAVYRYDNDSGPFSRLGDSGAAIYGTNNVIVAQLIGGAGSLTDIDITYGTRMEPLWKVIKEQFPTAHFFFDDRWHLEVNTNTYHHK
ncbi:hypothetical protein FB446DRAFT_677207 [Lentinula raphanica]|nr:hypothetical protein FB446DRAFT_677207 [Lentinula raphanica]